MQTTMRSLLFTSALFGLAACDLTSVTSTQTVYATTTASNSGACDNFYGACVVYGNGGSAAYTITVYASSSPTPHTTTAYTSPTSTFSTSTTTIVQTTTVTNANACNNYDGSCVVYTSNGGAATTIYAGSTSTGGNGNGNGNGVIGAQATGSNNNGGGSGGAIGAAAGLKSCAAGVVFMLMLASSMLMWL